MPVSGFPTILENIPNSLFQESQLASYKLAGNQQKTTLVLQFDAMADTRVSTSHLSTPAEARPILPTSINGFNAQDSKDCCKSDTPMLALDSQDTQAAEKAPETTVPDQELVHTRKKIAQPERNKTFKKLPLDTFEDTCSIVAGTEDLIVEYCIRKRQIINFFTIEDKEITPYKRMRKRHIKDWPDDTLRIKEEVGPEILDSFLTELQLLKHSIQEDAARYC
ncbi:hypothetical protein ElyMa_000497500 [Elysia marginata]|uniref:Uncharacterized protein n=1 Tax=Elysia marginata TaxID=1093978 RepID=A0AAV4FXH2_9GAST|nr:hypothetical protein ElyMa_000497500 [Elysia marginata]